MNILITGGLGFIGINLVTKLIEKFKNTNICILDNVSRSTQSFINASQVKIIKGDILDKDVVEKAVKNQDIVIHLAAYGSVIESIANPSENFAINVQGTLNMLKASEKANVKKFIFASTGGALMGNTTPPVNEHSLPKPISPYGASKLCGEAYCSAFAGAYGLNTIALRFANVYGKFSGHKKGAITVFIKALLQNKPLEIYGDGSASRDFLYVEDLCQGIILAIENTINSGTIIHLASGVETTINQLAQYLIAISKKETNYPIQYKSIRQGEVMRNFANYELASQLLGFKPSLSIQEGLKITWDWFEQNQDQVLMAKMSDS